jgi:hypothetical protein
MAKASPFSKKVPMRFRLIKPFKRKAKFDLTMKRTLRFKRRKLRLITRARLAAAKFIAAPFARKKKKSI